jgi:Golgi phosphoprotein 3
VFTLVIGGAALMDLAIHNRIDTDLDHLMVVDRTPLGDDILDDALGRIAKVEATSGGQIDITEALYEAATYAETYRPLALKRLIARGILKEENGRHLWVFRSRRYPLIDNTEQQEVRTRLRQILLSDEIPDPRDIVLICLVDACALMRFVLNDEELTATVARVQIRARRRFLHQRRPLPPAARRSNIS